MTYQETLKFLYEQLPMYQREGKSAYKKDLTNTIELLNALDDPHKKFKSVHIAGTNGKGTSAHGIAAIFQLSGYKTGLYTSPHLKNFTERIKIDGNEIEVEHVISFVERIRPFLENIKPSFFEITVAMAFDYFARNEVDIAIIETGLGGRLDSTNVISPEACLITNIGYDHIDLIGDTLEKIATEKAGIIKAKTPVVIGKHQKETAPVFEAKAKKENARLVYAEHLTESETIVGPYFKTINQPAIYSLTSVLQDLGWDIEQNKEEGFERMEELTGLKGRFQTINHDPIIIADVSHNEDGLGYLFDYVHSILEDSNAKLHLIFGTVKEKDLDPIFDIIPKNASIYWTQSQVPRSLPVNELAIHGVVKGLEGECFKDVNEAIQQAKAKAQPNDLILITGSTFVVAEVDAI